MSNILREKMEWLDGIEKSSDPGAVFIVRLRGLEVGRLWREEAAWTFRYSDEFRAQRVYKPITDFPDVNREYRSSKLWPFFVLRIPSLRQTAVRQFMSERNLKTVDEVTLLRQFGRLSISNPFELVPG